MAEEFGCRVDELPGYYGGDLWNPDGDEIGYTGNYDGQSGGRARHRIAWTMSGEHTMSLRILIPPASTSSFLPGLFGPSDLGRCPSTVPLRRFHGRAPIQ